jgi:hypothetical protein
LVAVGRQFPASHERLRIFPEVNLKRNFLEYLSYHPSISLDACESLVIQGAPLILDAWMVRRSVLIEAIDDDFNGRLSGYHKSRREGLSTRAGVMLDVRSANVMELAAALPREIGAADAAPNPKTKPPAAA